MKCPKCQHENPADAIFCNRCATKLELKCQNCEKLNPPDSLFCNKCATSFRKSEKDLPIDYSQPQSYTPKHLANKILTTRSALEGERKIVTVLFADVANYTSMSEKLDPEEVLQIMDGAFKIMMDETHKYEGTINQFTGDGIMAIFGAPVAHENHAQRACYTALTIQNAMLDYSERIKKKYGADFKIRIGINSGAVIVSAIGDDLRMDYTAVGDTTNLASRMESMAKPGAVFVSANTHKIVERYFEFNFIGKTEIKGKEEPQDIYVLIKAGDVVTRIDASIAKGLTRFVGRKNSMAALMEVYDKVKSGLGQVVGVVGEAGVGKSRLILEFINSIINDNHTYLEGQCLQYGGSILYKPILDILKSFFDVKDNDREFIIKKKIKIKVLKYTNLEQAIPSFQDLLSVKVDDENFLKLEPKQKREKAFESIRDLLISISQEKPLIVVVEDLHWIDDSSEEFLNYLIEWIANTPVMLVLLYRTEYQHKWSSKTYYHKIGLDHLGKDSAVELVKAMLEDGDVAAELRDLILARAAGNPLFMEEFTQSLVENGTIKKQENKYILSRKITEIHVPDTVQGIIAARMDRLEENLKRTMQVASVIGRDFAFRVLQTITGMREELKSYLLNLQGLEFIYEKRLFPELEYIFKHALTQEVAYNSLLLKRRKQIHENIGKAIENLYCDRLEEFYEMLAYHYSRGENFEKAFHYFRLSAQKAQKNYAHLEAVNFFKEAIGSLRKMPRNRQNEEAQIDLTLSMDPSLRSLSYPDDILPFLKESEKISRKISDKKRLSSIISKIGFNQVLQGDHLGEKYLVEAYEIAKEISDISIITETSHNLCVGYYFKGKYNKLFKISQETLDLLRNQGKEYEYLSGPFNPYATLNAFRGWILGDHGKFEEAINILSDNIKLSEKTNNLASLGIAKQFHGHILNVKGDALNAIKYNMSSIKDLETAGVNLSLGWALSELGISYLLKGDIIDALEYIKKGMQLHEKNKNIAYTSWFYTFLSMALFDFGDILEAYQYASQAVEFSKKYHEKGVEGIAQIYLGRILAKKDTSQWRKAEAVCLQGIKNAEKMGLKPYVFRGYLVLGDLHADIGSFDKALKSLNHAQKGFKEMGMAYYLSFSKSLIGKTLPKISPSKFFQAEQTIFDAIKIAQDIESKPALAHGRLCLGEICADNGQKEKALENLKKAEAMYEDMKMGLWLGKTREILDRIA